MNKPQLLKWNIAVSLACLALLFFISSASAAVLLTDTFTLPPGGVNNQDVNQGIAQGSRQTGPLASVSSGFFSTYNSSSSQHQIGNTTTDVGQPNPADGGYILLAGGSFQSDLDIAKVSTGPLTIQVDVYNNGADGGSADQTEWMGFTLRSPGNTFPIAGAGEFGILMRANGGFQAFQNGADITGGTYSGAGFTTNGTWIFTFKDTAGTGSAFVGNGSQVTISNVPTGFSVTYTLSQLSSSNLRLGFSNDQRYGGIDNLIISGALSAAPALSVLFHDNFNAVYGLDPENNNNMNNDLFDRQSGLLAPVNYTPGAWHHQIGNTGTDVGQPFGGADGGYVLTAFNGNFYSDLDIPVISTGPLKVEVDMYAANNDWLAFGLRHVPSDFFPIVGNGSGEFGMLRQPDGGLQLWDGSGSITPSGWNNAGFTPNPHMTFLFTDSAGTGSAFAGNGSKVTVLSGTTTLGTIILSQLSSSGLKLGFKADGNTLGGVDNLTVSGTAPAVIAPNLVTDIHPLRSEVVTGAPLTLSITVSGTPLNYHWYNQSGLIGGATTNSYTFNAVAGTSSYYCIVTNTSGSVTSSVATVISAANLVTVNNFSFENGSTPAFGNGSIPVQWTSYNGDWAGVSSGASQFSPATIPDGTHYFAVNTGPSHSGASGIYQDVGALQPNTTYTLTVAIGRGDNNGVVGGNGSWSPGIISLLNGTDDTGAVLATTTGYPDVAGSWQDYTATFTTGPSVSGDLTIELGVPPAPTYQSLFDNVRLTTGAPTATLVQTILPAHAETFGGDQIVFSAAYSNDVPNTLQWVQVASGPVTNNINTGVVNVTSGGVTTSTLTISSVQLSNAGTYMLEAINATNSAAIAYSPVATLVVNTPVTVGNVVQMNSAQAGTTNYYPGWTMNTNTDLIYGFSLSDGNSDVVPGPGTYDLETPLNLDPSVLSDGNLNSAKPNMVSCGWVNSGAGESMTYVLPAQTYGYEITNVTVYGGWGDDGRNELKYQVLYSTFSAPATFVSIGTFDYNPGLTDNNQNANRCILIPVSGSLAHNVAKVQINFNMQSKNNWNGYSEITIGAKPSVGVLPVLTQDIMPNTAEDVVGGQLILTGAFSGATSYQWQKNGTNLVGQTGTTLTLNNLQLTDAATNGGYRLLGINLAGTNATRGCTVVVDPAPVAVGNVVTAVAYQTADTTTSGLFTPTWSTNQLGASLIAGQNPPALGSLGDFVQAGSDQGGGLPVLTDGNYGYFYFDATHPAFACGGPNAGEVVTYTLGANPNGYNVTNIQIAGGWNDNGRDSQYYTVSYSTVANPTMFSALTMVNNNLNNPGYGVNDATAVRTTFTPAAGALASNVYAIEVDFTYPTGVPNNYSGYSEISVFGAAAATVPPAGPVITTQHEETNNIWTLESPNLIADQLPSSNGPGSFTGEGCTEAGLTDGILSFGGNTNSASCGSTNGIGVNWVVFTPTNGSWNLTNIVTYTLWHDYGRCGQWYNLSYATVAAPNTWIPLTSVAYNPYVPHDGRASGNRVQISPAIGQTLLASNVAAVKFDFTPQGSQGYGWSGYTEIVLQGTNVPAAALPTLPTTFTPPKVSGGNLILTGSGGTPASAPYIWLSTTNLSAPIIWTTNFTGNLNAGAFSNAIPVSATNRAVFFRFIMP